MKRVTPSGHTRLLHQSFLKRQRAQFSSSVYEEKVTHSSHNTPTPFTIIKHQQWRKWRKRSVVTICAITLLWFWTHGTPALNDMNDCFMRTKSHPESAAWTTWPLSNRGDKKKNTSSSDLKKNSLTARRPAALHSEGFQNSNGRRRTRQTLQIWFVICNAASCGLHTDGETLLQPPRGSFRSTLITFNK